MQLTGCHNGNEMRNATYVDTQISIEWPYCSFSILWFGYRRKKLQKLGQILPRFSRQTLDSLRSTFKYSLVGLSPISKHLEVKNVCVLKMLSFASQFQLLSVFGNWRKSSYSYLNYYFKFYLNNQYTRYNTL